MRCGDPTRNYFLDHLWIMMAELAELWVMIHIFPYSRAYFIQNPVPGCILSNFRRFESGNCSTRPFWVSGHFEISTKRSYFTCRWLERFRILVKPSRRPKRCFICIVVLFYDWMRAMFTFLRHVDHRPFGIDQILFLFVTERNSEHTVKPVVERQSWGMSSVYG